MNDNLIRGKHLTSLGSAMKRYVDSQEHQGTSGAQLSTTPATQNGGLWYEIQNSKPVIKFFHDGRSYSIATTIDPISPQLNITPSSATIGGFETATAKVSYLGSGTISVKGDATYNATNKTISYHPEAHDSGTKIFTVSLSESYGYTSATATFTVNVQAVQEDSTTLDFESNTYSWGDLLDGIPFSYNGEDELSLSATDRDGEDVPAEYFSIDMEASTITVTDEGSANLPELLPITLTLSASDASDATITIEEG